LVTRDDFDRVVSMLKDDNGDIRQAAIEAIGKICNRDNLKLITSISPIFIH
jgi:HEAT repeat protein